VLERSGLISSVYCSAVYEDWLGGLLGLDRRRSIEIYVLVFTVNLLPVRLISIVDRHQRMCLRRRPPRYLYSTGSYSTGGQRYRRPDATSPARHPKDDGAVLLPQSFHFPCRSFFLTSTIITSQMRPQASTLHIRLLNHPL